MNNLLTLWEKALSILSKDIPSVSYDTWIKDIIPVSENGSIVYLEVSNDLHKDIMTKRYRQSVTDALCGAFFDTRGSRRDDMTPVFLTHAEASVMELPQEQKNPEAPKTSLLNSGYTFDTFVVGSSNQLAHAVSLGVAEMPGTFRNPLFLFGASGLGKTHLMYAIGNYISEQNPAASIVYVSSETFTNEFIASLASNSPAIKEQFRAKYRGADVLLLDDIQFIANKFGVQEELFHTFNTLYDSNRQIVISSDKPPKEIPQIEDRLRSRFECGIIADIQPPDFETKVAILMKKAEQIAEKDGVAIPISNEVFYFIAGKSASNIRQLEGSLYKVIAAARLDNTEITVDLAEKALKVFFSDPAQKRISTRYIIETVCDYFDLTTEDIKSVRKNREISYPRQIAMYLIRTMTETSLPKIAELFGGKDHTTVMHAVRKIEQEKKDDPDVERMIADLSAKIRD